MRVNDWVDALVALQATRDAGRPRQRRRHARLGAARRGHADDRHARDASTARSAAAISSTRRSASRATCIGGAPGAQRLHRFPLGASLGQCCGGVVNLLFEPVAGTPPSGSLTRAALRDDAHAVRHARADDAATTAAGRLVVTAAIEAVRRRHRRSRRRDRAAPAKSLRVGARARSSCASAPTRTPRCVPRSGARAGFDIVLFGAGHVGRALVQLLADIPCRVTWVDTRDDAFPADDPRQRRRRHAPTRRRRRSPPRRPARTFS